MIMTTVIKGMIALTTVRTWYTDKDFDPNSNGADDPMTLNVMLAMMMNTVIGDYGDDEQDKKYLCLRTTMHLCRENTHLNLLPWI